MAMVHMPNGIKSASSQPNKFFQAALKSEQRVYSNDPQEKDSILLKGLSKKRQCSTICCYDFFLFVFIFQLLLPAGSTVFASELTSVQSKMYQEKPFVKETYVFSPFDTVYVTVDFRYLKQGTYNLITDWKTPWGTLEHQSIHSFEILNQNPSYKVFSWLRLWKNGPFKRVVTGEEYKKEFYGMWEVTMYLNGDQVAKNQFEVQ